MRLSHMCFRWVSTVVRDINEVRQNQAISTTCAPFWASQKWNRHYSQDQRRGVNLWLTNLKDLHPGRIPHIAGSSAARPQRASTTPSCRSSCPAVSTSRGYASRPPCTCKGSHSPCSGATASWTRTAFATHAGCPGTLEQRGTGATASWTRTARTTSITTPFSLLHFLHRSRKYFFPSKISLKWKVNVARTSYRDVGYRE